MALSAHPPAQSTGQGGPLNQLALDIDFYGPKVPSIECDYPGQFRYRCSVDYPQVTLDPPRTRVRVTVPDLDKGRNVTLKLANGAGSTDFPLELINPPQVIHEIVALPLPGGGQAVTGPDGRPMPVSALREYRVQTTPAASLTLPYQPNGCDLVYALWSANAAASATDAVFTSAFGPLTGSVILEQPVLKNSPFRESNGPHWLITYAASAQRVQFIAHYDVVYRAGVCADRIIAG